MAPHIPCNHEVPHYPCSRRAPRGEMLEADTWHTMTGDTCHALTNINIHQRYLTYWHVAHITCVHIISGDINNHATLVIWNFNTSGFKHVYFYKLVNFWMSKFHTTLSFVVHIVQLSSYMVVTRGHTYQIFFGPTRSSKVIKVLRNSMSSWVMSSWHVTLRLWV
jgi:hypothetical protein